MYKKLIHRSGILKHRLMVLHSSPTKPVFKIDCINTCANSHNPNGLYMVRADKHGAELLEDYQTETGNNKLWTGIVQPGIRIGFTREMWRMSWNTNTLPAMSDMCWNTLGSEPTEEAINMYRINLQKELSKYCDLLFIVNYAWISEWCEIVQLTDVQIDWL